MIKESVKLKWRPTRHVKKIKSKIEYSQRTKKDWKIFYVANLMGSYQMHNVAHDITVKLHTYSEDRSRTFEFNFKSLWWNWRDTESRFSVLSDQNLDSHPWFRLKITRHGWIKDLWHSRQEIQRWMDRQSILAGQRNIDILMRWWKRFDKRNQFVKENWCLDVSIWQMSSTNVSRYIMS